MDERKTKITIERYLMLVERQLMHLSVGDRANILHHVKSRIEEQLNTQGPSRLNHILQQLGPVERVAADELQSRGLPLKKSSAQSFKKVSLGLALLLTLTVLAAVIAVRQFSPLISFDDESGKVKFFGGALDLKDIFDDMEHSSFQFQSTETDENGNIVSVSAFSGKRDLNGISLEKIRLTGKNVKFEISSSADQTLSWKCQGKNLQTQPIVSQQQGRYEFDFSGIFAVRCELQFPQGIPLEIEAESLHLQAARLLNPLKATAENGKVFFVPSPEGNYRYRLSVTNGKVDRFDSSPRADAYPIEIALTNGSILKQAAPTVAQ